MIAKEALDFKVEGVTLRILATIFNIKGDPINYTSVRLQLGLAIWPGNEILQNALNGKG